MKPCEACTIAKARQKNVLKTHNKNKSAFEASKQWLHDILMVKAPWAEGVTVMRPVWHIVVDEATGVKIGSFYTAKNKMIEPMCEQIHKMEKWGQPVKHLRQDNAGKNKKLQERAQSADWKINITFK